MPDTDQQAVIDFLRAPETHNGEAVTQVDTHAAAVFLAGPRVLKIKRAVKFPFLDFSTLEKRKAACEAEIRVNRPYAPSIYRRVLPITRDADGRLTLAGEGAPVEWAVEMTRFDETQTLDHLAQAGRLDATLAEALGRAVAAAHAKAPVVRDIGFAATLGEIVTQNDGELTAVSDLFPADTVARLTQATHAALERLRPLLITRERDGYVRRCHGDLHLGNIALIDGQPTLFDAIEFDERFATIDVLYDLAFLLMDLIERGLQPQANIVLNRYLIEMGRDENLDALATLPLFMSVRAAIRAKVTAAQCKHEALPHDTAQRARDYFALACRLIAPPSPQLVAVGGLSGTGKSVLARALAALVPPSPGAVVLRSDIERKAMFGIAETDRLPPEGYTREATEKVYATLAAKTARVLAAGHSAIVDAVFASPDERHAITAVAGEARFHGLFLTTDLATRVGRVGVRMHDASDADAAIARQQEQYQLGAMDWAEVDASGTPDQTFANVKTALHLT